MSQVRKKLFKSTSNQPQISGFINTCEDLNKSKHSDAEDYAPSNINRDSKKRKKDSPPSETLRSEQKRVFSSNNITPTTMDDQEQGTGEKLMLQSIKDLLKPLDERMTKVLSTQEEMKSTIGEAATLKSENEKLKQRMSEIEEKNEELSKRLSDFENRLLENNIVLTGIHEGTWESDEVRREKIYEAMSETVLGRSYEERINIAKIMSVKSTRRIGRYRQLSNRPIIVEFTNKEDADYLIYNRRYLPQGVYIDREYSKETEERRKELRPYLRAARRMPKYQCKCRLDSDALIIKGMSYKTTELAKLPDDLKGENISCKTDKGTYGFFGKLHPFSNFYKASFVYQGLNYHSSEQMIQHLKASYFGDEEIATKILESKTALESKILSKEINDYNHEDWCSIAKNMCESGIKAKFEQNAILKNKLLATKGKVLAECCMDYVWGTGVPLHEDNALNQERWVNQGILGEMLQEL